MGRSVRSQKRYGTRDDNQLFFVRRDISGGSNTRQHPSVIKDNEGQLLQNVNLEIPGEASRIPGLTLIEDLSNSAITGMANYDPQQNTANLLVTEGVNLKRWTGSGTFSTVSTAFTTGLNTKIVKAYKSGVGDVALIGNGTDAWYEMTPGYSISSLGTTAGTGSDSPPKSTVATFYRNRFWILIGDLLYYSDASPSDYSTAFDTVAQAYRVPVGEERALWGTRDLGLLVCGKEQIWALNPSTVPAATDKPEKLLDIGVVTGKTFCQVGDDYFFFATDGVRALKRTIQDKVQLGESQPLSYRLKDEFDTINWNYISKASAVYFQNKYFISLPKVGSTVNNMVWVYFTATGGWAVIDGWSVSDWAVFKVNGEERLYAGDSTDGKVYRAWYGSSNNGTAIPFVLEGKQEDFGKPLEKKVCAELKVSAKPTGNYNLTVSASFDGGGYNTLGTMNLSTNLISFPTTFPVLFYPDQLSYKKFHLDSYGPFYNMTYKITNSDVTTNADDITIYEVSATALADEYISEESI